MSPRESTDAAWPEVIATVLECHYDMRAGRALAFGVPGSKHFRIRYNYFANGETHEAELYSATAMPQHTLFPVRYNPADIREHTHTDGSPTSTRNPLIAFGVIGSIILSLVWLLILRGCS
jgi:hypothetical protein